MHPSLPCSFHVIQEEKQKKAEVVVHGVNDLDQGVKYVKVSKRLKCQTSKLKVFIPGNMGHAEFSKQCTCNNDRTHETKNAKYRPAK